MNVNKNYIDNVYKFYEQLEKKLGHDVKSREKALQCIKDINNYLSSDLRSDDHLEKFKNLRIKFLDKAKGGLISNIFLKIFNFKKYDLLKQETDSFEKETKPINKLLKENVDPKFLDAYLNKDKNLLDVVLFNYLHVYEKMSHFGHQLKLNSNQEPVFNVSKKVSLNTGHNSLDKIEDWNKIKDQLIQKNVKLQCKGEFSQGRYQSYDLTQMSSEELKNLLVVNEEGKWKWNQNISLFSIKEMTIPELKDQGIIKTYSDNKEYINSDYTYGENGFEKKSLEWKDFKPYHHTLNPPKDYTVDIIVHSKPGLPGVFDRQTHASVKITTPNGEIYSIGFYPNYNEDQPDGRLRQGSLRIPDEFQMKPSHSYEQHVMRYSLSDPKKFHELINWIEKSQANRSNLKESGEVFNLLYHPTHRSCAFFADVVKEKVLELGAKSEYLTHRKISNWTKAGIKFKKFLLHILLTNPLGRKLSKWDSGIERNKKKYNITDENLKKKFYLTIDILVDYQTTAAKVHSMLNK